MNLHPDIATRPEAVQHIKDDIIQQFVEIQLDNADSQFLLELATSYLTDCYSELTLKEIEAVSYTHLTLPTICSV